MSTSIQGLGQRAFELGGGAPSAPAGETAGGSEFMSTLRTAMTQVGELQNDADAKVSQLLTGNGQDVHSAMIAVEKANLAFEMMVQVRNKIVQAYQQVSGIPF